MSSFSVISPSSIASYSGLKILVFGDYGAANLRATTSTRGVLGSLPGGAFCFARSAPWPSMTFAGSTKDAAPGYIRLSACAGLPAPHKITSRPPIGGAQRCTAPGTGRLPLSALRAHAASEPGQGSPRISFYSSDK